MTTGTTVGVIGLGRVGSAIARAVAGLPPQTGHRLVAVSPRGTGGPSELADQVGVASLPGPQLMGQADLTVIAVPDDALAGAAARLAEDVAATDWAGAVVHCSGALDGSALRPLADLGRPVGAWHPLQAFPTRSSPVRPGITWALTAPEPLAGTLASLTRAVQGRPVTLAAAAKPAYHCAATMAANYLVTQVWHAVGLLESCGLTRPDALSALIPLLDSTVAGLAAAGLPDGLTGPLARGDTQTVARHLHALEATPTTGELYRAAGTATLPILTERGLDPAIVHGLEALLGREAVVDSGQPVTHIDNGCTRGPTPGLATGG